MSGFNLSALAVRERAITLFLLIALLLAGVFAFFDLGRAEDPPYTLKVLTVSASWPGATAQEMQDLVADPLEKRLQELQYYDRVETYARPGIAVLTLFLQDGAPPKAIPGQFYQARKKLADEAHNLPSGASGPFVNDEYSDIDFAVYTLDGHGVPERTLARQAETLREQLREVPGVKKVNILGERPERVFVNLSHERLATLGFSARDVIAALKSQNVLTAAGSIDTSGPQVFIRLDGALDDLQKVRDTPIAINGRILRLSDIATVERGYDDPPSYKIRHDGEAALALTVVMKDGYNGLTLGKALDTAEVRLRAQLPVGVSLTKVTDQAVNISEAVDEFMLKFFVALAVVMLVSLLSLGWRVGIIVAAAVPLTLATVLVVMLFTDRVFDRITLGALIIALGLLVDDAIIAIETMVVKMEEGVDRLSAASYAWSHTAGPMLSGTLVTIIGFMPIGFARSTAGEYAGGIFWVTGIALIVSWLVAVAFTPYLGVKLLPDIPMRPGGHAAIYATPRYNRFRRLLERAVVHKLAVVIGVVVLLVLAGAGMTVVKQQFFPGSDRPELLAEVQMPNGSSIEATDAATKKVEAWLKRQPETRIVTTYVGGGAARFYISYNPELPDPTFAKIVVLTSDDGARDRLKERLRQRIAAGLAPEAKLRVAQLVLGPYQHFPVAFRVMGPDPIKLRQIAGRVQDIMRDTAGTRDVTTDWGERTPTLHFVLDQQRLQGLGLTPADVAEQLQLLLTGVTVSQIREDIRTVDLVVRTSGTARLDPARIGEMTVTNRAGASVSVNQIGKIQVGTEDSILRRRDRVPTITVQSDIDETLQPPQVSATIDKALQPLRASLGDGYRIEMGGNIEDSVKANNALAPVFPVMLALTMLVIVVQVRSISAMFMVLMTMPLGLIGAVPMLLLFHQPFGFNAILGLLGLSGILMRNTLILIGQIHINEAAGLDPHRAVIEATVQRSRPVLLTAVAAVLAFIPLTQSVFWGPLAYTLIGGTAVGTVLILVFLPALYSMWFGIGSDEKGRAPGEPGMIPAT